MRVPLSWLREHCDPGMAVDELASALALRSTEVERISQAGPPSPEGFVVGRVVEVGAHPDADRLSVCEVDTGDREPRTIVCGAANVAAGQKVPVALPGAVLPEGGELKRAKLRGVVSDGMILSEAELRIGDDADGISVLDGDAEPGTALSDVLAVAEPVLELEVHSNRVDCFGVRGVAREVHAITGAELVEPPWAADAEAGGEGRVEDYASVTVEVPELCPRFTARVFTDVEIGPSPPWLKARLTAAGQRPINNVVDITNYVMLLTAQPLHAFDLDRVPGGELIVRTAADGETMTTLDGVERRFDAEAVLVCDRDGPSGIAGIMGGADSEVSTETTRVLLEVATWNGVNILRTSRKLGLRSEASNRFEKQLHPEIATRAQRIASRLLVELCGARLVPGTIDVAAEIPPPHVIALRSSMLEGVLGIRVEPRDAATYLERLGFEVETRGEDLEAVVPVDRHYDVTREADLIEEVGRIHGLDRLPETLPRVGARVGRLSREQRLRRRAEDALRDLGFDNVLSLSLSEPDAPQRLRIPATDGRREAIAVRNPLSIEHSALRTTLLSSLLEAAAYNLARGADRMALFESGRVYLREGASAAGGPLGGGFAGERPPPAFEPHRIGAVAVGPLAPPDWRGAGAPTDFFALKGALEALAAQLGVALTFEPADEPFLHPGRAARVFVPSPAGPGRESEGESLSDSLARAAAEEPALMLGWLGEVHPLVCREFEIEAAAGFEIGLAELLAASRVGGEAYEDVTTHPAVFEDIAVVVDADVPASRVRDAVLEGGGELLRSARIFDLYRGEQVGEGRKSLALRLSFSAPDRTLTDEEVAARRDEIKGKLAEIGGSLRE